MKSHTRRTKIGLSPQTYLVAIFGFGVFAGLAFQNRVALSSETENEVIYVSEATNREVVALAKPRSSNRTVNIAVRSQQTRIAENDTLKTLQTHLSELSRITTDSMAAQPNGTISWETWARLSDRAVEVQTNSPNDPDTLLVYAVGSPSNTTLCVWNRSEDRLQTNIRIAVPRGIYRMERVGFLTEKTETTVQKENLQGRFLPKSGDIRLPYTLLPGQLTIIRCSETTLPARQSLEEAQMLGRRAAAVSPGVGYWMLELLYECRNNAAGINWNKDLTPAARVAGIHRLMIALSHAQMLNRNFLEDGRVRKKEGEQLLASTNLFEQRLADVTASLLGLVPEVRVDEGDSMVLPVEDGVRRANLTLSLTNTGSKTIELVKLGIDTQTLPSGMKAQPAEAEMFYRVRPGHKVSTTYRLVSNNDAPISLGAVAADFSCFINNFPVRIRPQL